MFIHRKAPYFRMSLPILTYIFKIQKDNEGENLDDLGFCHDFFVTGDGTTELHPQPCNDVLDTTLIIK